MLNSRDGWIFIGVDDQTTPTAIKPFPPRYVIPGRSAADVPLETDRLIRDIRVEVDRICPRPGNLVHMWPILDDDSLKCVVAVYIHRGDKSKDYLYRNKCDKKTHNVKTPKQVKWIKVDQSIQIEPDWLDANASE
jgi:hypothetical protein